MKQSQLWRMLCVCVCVWGEQTYSTKRGRAPVPITKHPQTLGATQISNNPQGAQAPLNVWLETWQL
eukprot:5749949-Amphidinium_carterae.1